MDSATVVAVAAPEGYTSAVGDCDDGDPGVNPEGVETCDGRDEDCDGVVDEDDAVDASVWYGDGDGDGYGTSTFTVTACEAPPGYAASWTDCDDGDPGANPGAAEICDGSSVDEDCDGLADDLDDSATGQTPWYTDTDGDGYGDDGTGRISCDPLDGEVAEPGDCDEADAAIHPGADEVCDAADIDEDCDGLADDGDRAATGRTPWYTDGDGDGYGDEATEVSACDPPAGAVATPGDCDDGDASVSPDATEVCDAGETDEDCDGLVDDDDPEVTDPTPWYADADGDGFGDPASPLGESCTPPPSAVADATDRDDTDAFVSGVDVASDAWASVGPSYGVGQNLQVMGDLDGDGLDELLTGGSGSSWGLDYWYWGTVGTWYSDPDGGAGSVSLIDGGTCCRDIGKDIAALDDLDGDGLDDLAYTSSRYYYSRYYGDSYRETTTGPGNLNILAGQPATSSATTLYSCSSSDGSCPYSSSVERAPDVDGDGVDDVFLSYTVFSGAAFGAGAVEQLVTWTGVSGAVSDMDGDGIDEVIGNSTSGSTAVQLASAGEDTGAISDLAWVSLDVGQTMDGYADLGDVDGDGYSELAIVADSWKSGGVKVGGAFVLHGGVGGSLTDADVPRLEGADSSNVLSTRIGAPGDIDADGVAELAVAGTYDGSYGAWALDGDWSGTCTTDSVSAFYATGDAVLAFGNQPADRTGDGVDDLVLTSGAWESPILTAFGDTCYLCSGYVATLSVFEGG